MRERKISAAKKKFYAGKNIDEFSVKFEREMKMVNQARYLSEFE